MRSNGKSLSISTISRLASTRDFEARHDFLSNLQEKSFICSANLRSCSKVVRNEFPSFYQFTLKRFVKQFPRRSFCERLHLCLFKSDVYSFLFELRVKLLSRKLNQFVIQLNSSLPGNDSANEDCTSVSSTM